MKTGAIGLGQSWNLANAAPRGLRKTHVLPAIVESLVVVPIAVLVWMLPPALVLPASSLVLLAGAVVAGLLAWLGRTEPSAPGITLWDLAGAFAFFGFAAGSLSKPMHAAHLLGITLPVQ